MDSKKLSKKIKILKMKDKSDNSVIKFKSNIFNLPMRLGVVGNSGSGKSSIAFQLLIDPLKQFYSGIFEGSNIFIFSGSTKSDNKLKSLISCLEVPKTNIFNEYSDDLINIIYDEIEEENSQIKGKIPHTLFLFDDLSFDYNIRSKKNNGLGRLFLNGRKNNISTIFISQKYNQIPPQVRVNLTGLILFNMPTSELEAVERDHNFLTSKKSFYQMFRNNIKERHDALVINYSNSFKDLYLDKNFERIEHIN